jgi:hypothetical protein
MLTYNTQYGYASSLPLDRLRTAAWLQYLLDRLERVAHAMVAGGNAAMAAAGHDTLARLRGGARQASRADASLLDALFAAILGDDAAHGRGSGSAYGTLAVTPARRELLLVDRYVPGSKRAFDRAHGVIDAYAWRDPEIGWAALEAIATGVGAARAVADEPAEPPEPDSVRAARDEGQSARRIIDTVIGHAWQADDDLRRLDEMAALVEFAAAIATHTPITPAAYGGDHNSVARAIWRERGDLASADGLFAALSVCRLEQLTDAGSFWAYYLLAGVRIAAPDVMRELGRHFYGDAWRSWLDALLALPATGELDRDGAAALSRLEASMSLVAHRNPIVHGRRRSTR